MCGVIEHLLPSRVERKSAIGARCQSGQTLFGEVHHLSGSRVGAVRFVIGDGGCLQFL